MRVTRALTQYIAAHGHLPGLRRVLPAMLLVTLSTVFAPPFVRIAGPAAWSALGLTEAQWSLVTAIRGLFYVVFILGAGIGGDFWGRRRVLLLLIGAFFICNLALIGLPIGPIFFSIYVATAILGIMVQTLSITNIIVAFQPRDQFVPVLLYSLIVGIGFLLSPLVAEAIAATTSFRSMFVLPALLSAAAFALARRNIAEGRVAGHPALRNVVALAVWIFGLCVLIFSAVEAGGLGWDHPVVIAGMAFGLLILLGIKTLERSPLPGKFRFKLQSVRQLSVAIYASVIMNVALYAMVTQTFNFMTEVWRFGPVLAAVALVPILIGATVLTLLTGRYTVRLGLVGTLSVSLVVIALPAAVFSLLQTGVSYLVLAVALAVLGFGFILGNTPKLLLFSSSLPHYLSATAQAIGSATSQLASALAYSLMLTVLQTFSLRALHSGLAASGPSGEQAASILRALIQAGDEMDAILSIASRTAVGQQVKAVIDQAYVVGLSHAMFALFILCLASAPAVYFGLRRSSQNASPPTTVAGPKDDPGGQAARAENSFVEYHSEEGRVR